MSIELLFIEPLDYTFHGLRVIRIDGEEYAVADTDEQAERAALSAARESLWAFNAVYIGGFLGLNMNQRKAVEKMQGELCEDAQEIIELLLGDRIDELLEDAVDTDGRGHFLSPYDSEETDGEGVSPALEGKLVYRIN
jgi:hypothetical protein